jgi:glycosidase
LDNHDLNRFYSVVGEDTTKYKMGLAWLLTFRGIPQLYYGDEILMTGSTNPDGKVRLDFKEVGPAILQTNSLRREEQRRKKIFLNTSNAWQTFERTLRQYNR